jgi:hypothetical protein
MGPVAPIINTEWQRDVYEDFRHEMGEAAEARNNAITRLENTIEQWNATKNFDRLTWSVTGDDPIVGDDRRILEYRPCCPQRGEVVPMAVGVCGGTLAAQQARFGDHLVPGTQRRERSALRVYRAQDRVDSRIEDLPIPYP